MGIPPVSSPPPPPPPESWPSTPAPLAPEYEGEEREPRLIWPWIVAGVVLVVIIVIVALVLAGVGKSPAPKVTYTGLGFEWDTPPSNLCNDVGISSPGVPFTVNTSQTFNVSWYLTCTSGGGPSTIHSVSMLYDSSGSGKIVSSNVPVTIYSGNYTYFNVTCTAPGSSYDGPLLFMIVASSP
jgi:hypothetical protein